MSIDINAKNARIWRKDFKGKNGEFHRYTVSVSSKKQDGSYVNAYIRAMFSKKSGAPEKITNGAVCDFRGFMSADGYTDREGHEHTEPMIIIMEAEFQDEDVYDNSVPEGSYEAAGFAEVEDDIPF